MAYLLIYLFVKKLLEIIIIGFFNFEAKNEKKHRELTYVLDLFEKKTHLPLIATISEIISCKDIASFRIQFFNFLWIFIFI